MAHDSTTTIDASAVTLPRGHALALVKWAGLAVGVIGVAVSYFLRSGHEQQFHASWLVSYLYFLSIALGGLFFVMVLFLTKAGWGVTVRRLGENVMVTLPMFAVLFLPVVQGMGEVFHWSVPGAADHDPLLQAKAKYLDKSLFLWRAAAYLVIWTLLAWFFSRQSHGQDRTGDHRVTRRLQMVSAPGVILFAFSVSFAAIDWMMSLDPHWFSTIFGVYYFSGCLVGIFAFLIVMILLLQAGGLLHNIVTAEHFHDLGKLLFAFTVFWTYIAFSQYFLIWYANIPEETIWYLHRLEGPWLGMTIFLAMGHFIIPFFYLMSRTIKRIKPLLLLGAIWMLFVHFVDIYWIVMPTQSHGGIHFGILDVTTFLGVGGLFVFAVGWVMGRRALIPVKDPRLPESLGFENF